MNLNVRQSNVVKSQDRNILCLATAAAGKALKNGSKLYTKKGPIKIEDAKVGMQIYGDDGELHKITGVYPQGKKREFLVKFSDNTVISCCNEHLWTFQTREQIIQKSKEWNTHTLQEIIDEYSFYIEECEKKVPNIYLPITTPVKFPKRHTIVTPYYLGVLIGKGKIKLKNGIPNRYKYNSITKRLDLIMGLANTCSLERRPCDLILHSEKIASDVKEILESLGDTVRLEKIDQIHNTFYHLRYDAYNPRTIVDIQPTNNYVDMTCISIDSPSKLFVTDNFIVTHNTHTVIERISHLLENGADPKKIVAFTFTNQAAQEMRKRLGEKAEGMFVGTIHSFANLVCANANINTRKYIEQERFDKIIEKALRADWSFYPQVNYLFVDEFQDTDPLQYEFIQNILVKNRFYCGDERQFIYSFRGASDKFIRELATDDDFKKYYLVENYRNPPNFIKFADSFLNSMRKISPPSEPVKKEDGFLDTDCSFNDALEEMTWTDDWTGWTVICRTNSEVEEAERRLNEKEIPNVIVKRGDLDIEHMGDLLRQNKVKIMTTHASKGLEFDNVVAVGMKTFNLDERRICYVAATRAMKSLYWCPSIRQYKGKAKGNKHLAGNVFSKTSKKSITF